MSEIRRFDASEGVLPIVGPGRRLDKIRFHTCPGSSLVIRVLGTTQEKEVDEHGVYRDAWYKIECKDLPPRYIRLYDGSHSLSELLRRYGFLDAGGCVNHRDVTNYYSLAGDSITSDLNPLLLVPRELRDLKGVPQFYRTSGVCWFATLCWTSYVHEYIRDIVARHLPPEMLSDFQSCLKSRDAAQRFRNALWYRYAIGDDVEQPPEMDGRNGFTEFTTMCAKLKIPIIRFREEHGVMCAMPPTIRDRKGHTHRVRLPSSLDEPHLLVMRHQDGEHEHRFPVQRRIRFQNKRYCVAGLYMGQRKCGHQIGAACPGKDWRVWGVGDADLHKSGIGPLYIIFDDTRWTKEWWNAWKQVVHVTKFGTDSRTMDFCNLSPQNPPDAILNPYRYRGPEKGTGLLSLDIIYRPC